jgi:prepilin signal peptidase PulO-like enzyme (type II secretory pathway)
MTLFVLASVRGTATPSALVVLACATASAISDLQTGYIFDRMLATAIPLLIAAAFVADRVTGACLGACATGGLLLLPFVVSRGRALGLADVKLGALIGFGLGPAGGLAALWCAAVSGGIVAVSLLLFDGATRRSTLPFGPFLAIGASCAVLAR